MINVAKRNAANIDFLAEYIDDIEGDIISGKCNVCLDTLQVRNQNTIIWYKKH